MKTHEEVAECGSWSRLFGGRETKRWNWVDERVETGVDELSGTEAETTGTQGGVKAQVRFEAEWVSHADATVLTTQRKCVRCVT